MSYVNLFATFTFVPGDTQVVVDFDGNDGATVNPENRLMPPPLAGVIKRVTLRTISQTDTEGFDYFLEMWGTRLVGGAAAPGNADRAAFFIGRSLAPLVPTAATLAARDTPDLWQDVDWPYELQNPLAIVGDTGVPANVPGLQARLTVGTAIPDGDALVVGVGILVESKVPGYPSAPFQQSAGTAGGFWPGNV